MLAPSLGRSPSPPLSARPLPCRESCVVSLTIPLLAFRPSILRRRRRRRQSSSAVRLSICSPSPPDPKRGISHKRDGNKFPPAPPPFPGFKQPCDRPLCMPQSSPSLETCALPAEMPYFLSARATRRMDAGEREVPFDAIARLHFMP